MVRGIRRRLAVGLGLVVLGGLATVPASTAAAAPGTPVVAARAASASVAVRPAARAKPKRLPPRLVLSRAAGPSGIRITVRGKGLRPATRGRLVIGAKRVRVRTDSLGRFAVTWRMVGAVGAVPLSAKVGARTVRKAFRILAPFPVAPARLRFGVTTDAGPLASADFDGVVRAAGESPSLVMVYLHATQTLDLRVLRAIDARGAIPVVTFEPFDAAAGIDQPAYRLASIAAGSLDVRARALGAALRSYGRPVYLRFAHEMNGNWYPWAESVNGNASGDYVRAYRRIHAVVEGTGLPAVSWVWSPNVEYPGSTPLAGLYPGAAYVDLVAVDGYNWGNYRPTIGWRTPAELFDATFTQLRTIAPGKPFLLGETASVEDGGSKPLWVRQLFSWMVAQPDLVGFVWFDHVKGVDLRFNSSTGSAAEFRARLAARRASR